MDRRVKKTKSAIKSVVVDTYSKNPFAKLTISSLCEKIDINRSTFYLHYDSIDSVIKDLENETIGYLKETAYNHKDDPLLVSNLISDYIQKNLNTFKALIGVAQLHLLHIIFKEFHDFMVTSAVIKSIEDPTAKEYVITFIIYGCFGIFNKWICSNCQGGKEEIINAVLRYLRYK